MNSKNASTEMSGSEKQQLTICNTLSQGLGDVIQKYFKENVSIVHEGDCNDNERELEITVKIIIEGDKNDLDVKNSQTTEQHITILKNDLNDLQNEISEIRQLLAKQNEFKNMIKKQIRYITKKLNLLLNAAVNTMPAPINTLHNVTTEIEEKLFSSLVESETADTSNLENGMFAASIRSHKTTNSIKMPKSRKSEVDAETVETAETAENPISIYKRSDKSASIFPSLRRRRSHRNYDEIYYTQRQHAANLFLYKKSSTSLQLNKKPLMNPYGSPRNFNTLITTWNPKPLGQFIVEDNL